MLLLLLLLLPLLLLLLLPSTCRLSMLWRMLRLQRMLLLRQLYWFATRPVFNSCCCCCCCCCCAAAAAAAVLTQVVDALEDVVSAGGCLVDYHSCDFFPERCEVQCEPMSCNYSLPEVNAV
jgi:hypothetical protein